MMSYISFAEFYDELTENVGYKERCDYILSLMKDAGHPMGLTLDLACGTGTLTLELAQRGIDIFGADASAEMLCQAQNKALGAEKQILFLCQKMQELELYGSIDTCLCILDSINHLTDARDVRETFSRVYRFLNPGGYFIFDVNTVYKHREILADNTFVYDAETVYCVWQNTLLDSNAVQIDLDFFEQGQNGVYTRTSECFCERAYSREELEHMLVQTGFVLAGCYGDMTKEEPKEKEQRMVFVVKK